MHLLRHTHNHHDNSNRGIGSSKVSTLGLLFLFESEKRHSTRHPLGYGEFDGSNTDQNEQCIQDTLRKINLPLLRILWEEGTSSLVGSCNGLICLAESDGNNLLDPINICNPITGECLYLQGFNENNELHDFSEIYSGFGYTAKTNEYKVVRILYCDRSGRGYIQVYTLGGGDGWRYKGEIRCRSYEQRGVFVNGSVHWLGRNGKYIMAFNLSDEMIHDLPRAHISEEPYRFTYILGSLGEWLCVFGHNDEYFSKYLDIWTLKKTSPEKSIGVGVKDNKEVSWRWCKEFSISLPDMSISSNYIPFALTNSGLVLLRYEALVVNYFEQRLFCYDPKTATLEELGCLSFDEAVPHANSFVSLEALGEITCKKSF